MIWISWVVRFFPIQCSIEHVLIETLTSIHWNIVWKFFCPFEQAIDIAFDITSLAYWAFKLLREIRSRTHLHSVKFLALRWRWAECWFICFRKSKFIWEIACVVPNRTFKLLLFDSFIAGGYLLLAASEEGLRVVKLGYVVLHILHLLEYLERSCINFVQSFNRSFSIFLLWQLREHHGLSIYILLCLAKRLHLKGFLLSVGYVLLLFPLHWLLAMLFCGIGQVVGFLVVFLCAIVHFLRYRTCFRLSCSASGFFLHLDEHTVHFLHFLDTSLVLLFVLCSFLSLRPCVSLLHEWLWVFLCFFDIIYRLNIDIVAKRRWVQFF